MNDVIFVTYNPMEAMLRIKNDSFFKSNLRLQCLGHIRHEGEQQAFTQLNYHLEC